jgi:RimJ/RimL family protein N-acetyltransferase
MIDEITVRLREVVPSDLRMHFEQQRDPDSNRMAAVPPRDRPAFDAHWARILVDPTVVVRTILADGIVAGSVLRFVRDGQQQVGYWIAREHWGKGIATAAVAQLLGEVCERPLLARVAADNHGSHRVLEKCGFQSVGEERDEDVRALVLRLH